MNAPGDTALRCDIFVLPWYRAPKSSPGGRSKRSEEVGKRMSVEEFRKDHPRAVVLYQQPTEFEILETPEELKKWEEQLLGELGLSSLKMAHGRSTTITYDKPSNHVGDYDFI